MNLSRPDSGDVPAVRDVAYESMRASFALSPDQIESILEQQYGEDRLAERFGSADAYYFVAREDGDVVGFVEGELDEEEEGVGVVECLQVDPGSRGAGIGTRLFERIRDELSDAGAERIRARVLTADVEGETFYEQFDMVPMFWEHFDVKGTTHVVDVYGEADEAAGMPAVVDIDVDDLPERIETDEGTFFVDQEEVKVGTKAPFLLLYTDEDGEDLAGYYCTNCENLVQTTDGLGRIDCDVCANLHKADHWDGAYL